MYRVSHAAVAGYPVSPAVASGGLDVRDVPDVPKNLDFTNRLAVSDAHRHLAATPALQRFCDGAFDGVDTQKIYDLLAGLALCRDADALEQRTSAIPVTRTEAVMTLAQHLSPAGAYALLQTLPPRQEPNGFSTYLSTADRHWLIGQVYATGGETALALESYARAVHAFEKPERHGEAAYVEKLIADLDLRLGRFAAAGRTYAQAGYHNTLERRHSRAARDYQEAQAAFVQARWLNEAATMQEQTAASFFEAEEYDKAAVRYLPLAAYHRHDHPWAAALRYEMAATAFTAAGERNRAAHAFELAAACYTQAGRHLEAARALEHAERIYRSKRATTRANDAAVWAAASYEQAAARCAQAGNPLGLAREIAALKHAALALERADAQARAALIYRELAAAHRAAGELDLAERADAAANAAQAHRQEPAPDASGATERAVPADVPPQGGRREPPRPPAIDADGNTALAHERAAAAYARLRQFDPAIQCYEKAVFAYTQLGRHEQARDAHLSLATTHCDAARCYARDGREARRAADAWRQAADVYRWLGDYLRAAHAQANAEHVGQHAEPAASPRRGDAALCTAHAYRLLAEHLPHSSRGRVQAGAAWANAAAAYERAGDDALAAYAHIKAAQAFRHNRQLKAAHEADRSAAILYKRVATDAGARGAPAVAADAWEAAAAASARTGDDGAAARAETLAAQAYRAINQFENARNADLRAAKAYARVARHYTESLQDAASAATFWEKGAAAYQRADEHARVAETLLLAAACHLCASTDGRPAADAYRRAADAFRRAGQLILANEAAALAIRAAAPTSA
ncbi:hypothetical protein [Pandoraea sputorum]|uniref:Tetratricopeptide repeat protein n=1 Tax=Pandoraea sputorum TaxID=93222 RepID=A0A5E5BJY8_9BURK|nr:hypothetical protein [Pandoraea sputorum]VVE85658.1 hypothetical protein PSP31121_05344 [Pandoraea sputorum]